MNPKHIGSARRGGSFAVRADSSSHVHAQAHALVLDAHGADTVRADATASEFERNIGIQGATPGVVVAVVVTKLLPAIEATC